MISSTFSVFTCCLVSHFNDDFGADVESHSWRSILLYKSWEWWSCMCQFVFAILLEILLTWLLIALLILSVFLSVYQNAIKLSRMCLKEFCACDYWFFFIAPVWLFVHFAQSFYCLESWICFLDVRASMVWQSARRRDIHCVCSEYLLIELQKKKITEN